MGAWRTRDGAFPLDTSGHAPRRALVHDAGESCARSSGPTRASCAASPRSSLTYALGRGLSEADAPAVARIVAGASEGGWRFSRFVEGVVESVPFRKGRGEEASR